MLNSKCQEEKFGKIWIFKKKNVDKIDCEITTVREIKKDEII